MSDPVLISNSFPFSLIRWRVLVEPMEVAELVAVMRLRPWISVWGHANTIPIASAIVGNDLTPKSERPAIVLNNRNLPTLDGHAFDECWLLSPEYLPGYRPTPSKQGGIEKIQGWQVLRLTWQPAQKTSGSQK